ncbi:hypothetical protein WEH80_27630 [Actinomycetes bacterium KLBMP 9759]
MRRTVLFFLVGVVLAVSACAAERQPAPPSSPPSSPPSGPGADRAPALAAADRARSIDFCALHDTDAAARLVGAPVRYAAPFFSLDTCRIGFATGRSTVERKLTVTYHEFTELDISISGATRDVVAGVDVVRDDLPGVSCGLGLSWGEGGGGVDLTLDESADGSDACRAVLDGYFAAVLPRLQDPPQRSAASRSTFLTGKNPCDLLPQLQSLLMEEVPADRRGAVNDLEPISVGPYSCSIWGRSETPPFVRVDLAYRIGPVLPGLDKTVVQGRPASVVKGAQDCKVLFRPTDEVAVESTGWVETVELTGHDCAFAERAAAVVADALR